MPSYIKTEHGHNMHEECLNCTETESGRCYECYILSGDEAKDIAMYTTLMLGNTPYDYLKDNDNGTKTYRSKLSTHTIDLYPYQIDSIIHVQNNLIIKPIFNN